MLKMIFLICISIASVVGLTLLIYYIAILIYKPDKYLSFTNNEQNSIYLKICNILAIICLLIVVFFGIKSILFWIPASIGGVDEDGNFTSIKDGLSTIIALFAISLIGIADKSAKNELRCKQLEEINDELTSIITNFPNLAYKLQQYKDLSTDTNNINKSNYHIYFENIVEKMNDDITNLKKQAYITASEEINREINKAKLLKTETEKKNRQNSQIAELEYQMRDMFNKLNVSTSKNQYTSGHNLSDILDTSFLLIDKAYVLNRWNLLTQKSIKYFELNEHDIANGKRAKIEINDMFNNSEEITLDLNSVIQIEYTGDMRGGHTEISAIKNGHNCNFLDCLTIKVSIDSLIDALYFALELPTKGNYWHGLYGRDYKFLFDVYQTIQVLVENYRMKPDDHNIDNIDIPAGIRVYNNAGIYLVKCLAYYPNGTIADCGIRVENERICIVKEEVILKSSVIQYY